MPTDTFRAEIGDGIMAVFAAVQAHDADLLKEYHRARPASISEFPAAYIDNRPERIVHDAGTRTRTMNPSIVLVDSIGDNEEASRRFDELVDVMVEYLTLAPQLATGTIWSNATVDDEPASLGDLGYAAVRISLQDITRMVGRI
jgi:hypothetical protein